MLSGAIDGKTEKIRNEKLLFTGSEGPHSSPHFRVPGVVAENCYDGMNILRDPLRCLCLTAVKGRWGRRENLCADIRLSSLSDMWGTMELAHRGLPLPRVVGIVLREPLLRVSPARRYCP